jgi:hypothetical protein
MQQTTPDEAGAPGARDFDRRTVLQLRVARPVTDLQRSTDMYCRGLSLRVLGSFRDHDGFDGVMIGSPAAEYHFEFTHSRQYLIAPSPTPEDLLVFYYPSESQWRVASEQMEAAGFEVVGSFNPYWNARGRTYQDADGYRIVLQHTVWTPEV